MERGLAALETVADYQFGAGAGAALFDGTVEVRRTSSGRPQQVLVDGERVVSYGTDGRVTLGAAGAFAKFVREVDPAVRPGDEVLVEHYDGGLLAVGRAELSADGMSDFDTGMAVSVRDGVPADE
ncbi:pseudouridine synthase [Halobacteriales archaeon QH_10_70_21]|nr:MAG: pseudouridine synthase [Halobacteriales archaeon QH_10_70_21]